MQCWTLQTYASYHDKKQKKVIINSTQSLQIELLPNTNISVVWLVAYLPQQKLCLQISVERDQIRPVRRAGVRYSHAKPRPGSRRARVDRQRSAAHRGSATCTAASAVSGRCLRGRSCASRGGLWRRPPSRWTHQKGRGGVPATLSGPLRCKCTLLHFFFAVVCFGKFG